MPRIAIERAAARPASAAERERYGRILRSVRSLTDARGEDAVTMQEVAKEAGVALNTLYRYFPSKAHLYTGVYEDEVRTLVARAEQLRPAADDPRAPVEAVLAFLDRAGESMLRRPNLARAIMNASAASAATRGESVREVDGLFEAALLHILRIDDPTPHDHRVVSAVVISWSAALGAVLNGRMEPAEFGDLVRLMVARLLRD